MARNELRRETQLKVVDQVLSDEEDLEVEETELDNTPSYVLIGSASIPVSKKAGKIWDHRIQDAISANQNNRALWDQAYIDYRKVGRVEEVSLSDTSLVADERTDENLVRENVKVLLRSTYTRNPKIEFSAFDAAKAPIAKTLTLGISALLNRRVFPGLNAKSRIRRAIVHAHLTNMGVLKLGYQTKEGSRQEALQNLYALRSKLKDAKDTPELNDLYAQLEQNEEMLPLYTNQGMTLSVTLPHRLIIDPACTMTDLSDANWVVEECYINTSYLQSKFMEETEKGKWSRKSDSSEVTALNVGAGTDAAEGVRERVYNEVTGYTDDERQSVLQKDKTKCYMIWDKLTREISLYIAGDMKYPLWVWEDDLKLSRFFQHFIVQYTEPVDGIAQPGESAHYAGAADEINAINQRRSFIRRLAYGEVIYNTKVLKAEAVTTLVNHLQNPTKFKAIGVEWDPEAKLSDVFQVLVPADANIPALYDKTDLMRSIDRVNATAPSQRGEEYKTNTTNKAIAEYNNTAASVTNELTDVVEDTLEELGWSMAELFMSKYDKEQVTSLVGPELAKPFEPVQVPEFNAMFSMVVAAGSTEKPTSENKKREALMILQGLGQFGQAAPFTTMMISTRMLSQAFSEFSFTEQDKTMLMAEVSKNFGAMGAPGAPPPGEGTSKETPNAG